MGTGGRHWWAQVGGTAGHTCVTLLGGTGGCTAGHRWMHRWAELVGARLGTGGRNLSGTAGHQSSGH
ncbi:unnamed protein product [Staurois parvus]|uniref:Uncharacterized protein n=1 Tax=Staurois parvus TaxID=386267 RepID=A0ABN9A6R0_9NEOB|nr:unnamed protein product [Staurois parvus]